MITLMPIIWVNSGRIKLILVQQRIYLHVEALVYIDDDDDDDDDD
jgi:hypothetical protein